MSYSTLNIKLHARTWAAWKVVRHGPPELVWVVRVEHSFSLTAGSSTRATIRRASGSMARGVPGSQLVPLKDGNP